MNNIKIVCIGGGHGLGHLLKVISKMQNIDLTGVVTTTDNGGSTGRLREDSNTIAWGDIRHCLSELSQESSIQSLLFEHRFKEFGELSGHSLGNLMFCAINEMCLKPTDSVKVMTKFLNIKVNLLPMSDAAAHLVSETRNKERFIGETSVDRHMKEEVVKLVLEPSIKPTSEVIQAISSANILFLGPGSFFTSTLPSLLMPEIVDAINENENVGIYFLTNVVKEFTNQCDELLFQLNFLKALGLNKDIFSVIPNHRRLDMVNDDLSCIFAEIPADKYGRHDALALERFVDQTIYNNT